MPPCYGVERNSGRNSGGGSLTFRASSLDVTMRPFAADILQARRQAAPCCCETRRGAGFCRASV